MTIKPRTPPGVLELLPPQQLAFQRMLDTIRHGFERFGFVPVETPVFELSEVLLTKSGGETEKQVFFLQSTGELQNLTPGEVVRPKHALRFDLTVPLARYVAEHEHELVFPFRRYQIQRVYRGERPQKGRFREFYQCDIDVIGKDKLALEYDAEMPAVIHQIFEELKVGKFTIHINNRKVFRSVFETLGIAEAKHGFVLHEVDRLGKQERGEIEARLAQGEHALDAEQARRLLDTLTAGGGAPAVLAHLDALARDSGRPIEGRDELARVHEGILALGVPEAAVKIDLSIARGLDYYTGTVYETFLDEHRRIGSICSGGRYDNLAGHYTKSHLPGVGISIGVTRLFAQLLELGLADARAVTEILVLQVEAGQAAGYAALATELRAAGFNVEVFYGDDKMAKQLRYADRARIPLAVIYGNLERDAGVVRVKDLRAGAEAAQHDVPRGELVPRLRQLLGR